MLVKEWGSKDELANKTQKQVGEKQKPFLSCLLMSVLPLEGVSHMYWEDAFGESQNPDLTTQAGQPVSEYWVHGETISEDKDIRVGLWGKQGGRLSAQAFIDSRKCPLKGTCSQTEASASETCWELETGAVGLRGWLCWYLTLVFFPGCFDMEHTILPPQLLGHSDKYTMNATPFVWPVDGDRNNTQNTTDTRVVVDGLAPASSYEFSVWVEKDGNRSSTQSVNASTAPNPVTDLRIEAQSNSSISLIWGVPEGSSSPPDLTYWAQCTEEDGKNETRYTTDTRVTVDRLDPGSSYECSVWVERDRVSSSRVTVRHSTEIKPKLTALLLFICGDRVLSGPVWSSTPDPPAYTCQVLESPSF
ncbi:hypothetical protein STEG23_003011 [Scotinomys teguina]